MTTRKINANFLQQRLKIRHLRLLQTISRTRSVNGAAEELGITQAAVSKAKAEVEDLLGMQLFRHDVERWQPTEIGERILSAANKILEIIDALNDEISLRLEGLAGQVVVGMRTHSLVPSLAQALAEFKTLYPRVVVKVVDASYSEIAEHLQNRTLNLVVSPLNEKEIAINLESVALRSTAHTLAASAGHPLLEQANPTWAEAVQASWCVTPPGTRTRAHLERILKEQKLEFPEDYIETNSLLLSISMMRHSPRLTILPSEVVQHISHSAIRPIPLPIPDIGDQIRLGWPLDGYLSPSAKRLRDFLILKFAPAEIRNLDDFSWDGAPVSIQQEADYASFDIL